jgi:hypothetical protein
MAAPRFRGHSEPEGRVTFRPGSNPNQRYSLMARANAYNTPAPDLVELHNRLDTTQLSIPKDPICELGLRLVLVKEV